MERSNIDNGRVKDDKWEGHNDPIKDNIKNKEKNNITKDDLLLNFISFDDEIVDDMRFGLAKLDECMSEQFYSFAFDEIDRLGSDVTFVVSYDKIKSYKNGKCMGSCRDVS